MFNFKINFPSKIGTLAGAVFTLASFFGANQTFADVPPLSVQGNKVLVGGQQTSLGGMSYFWGNDGWGGEKFYNPETVSYLKNDWNASLVRAAMGVEDDGGYFSNPTGMTQKVRTVVDAAIANDMYVIIDWHSHHAHEHDWSNAISFFQQMASEYGQNNHVIYEIYNEPLQIPWASVKGYAEAVISAIRAIDPDNLIVVGTPTWSQGVVEASLNPIQANNIAYTLHFYAGTHFQWLRDEALQAMNNGIALFVTEWGTVNADGNGDVNEGETAAWMNFLKQHGIHHANWSLNDKAEGASALIPGASATGGWNDSSLTWSGQVIRNYLREWPQIPGGPTDPVDCNTIALPGTLQAESYCAMEGVQTEPTTDAGAGLNVGWIEAGDWLSYSVDNLSAGEYEVSYRVASLNGGGSIQIEQAGGGTVYGNINVPSTDGWQNWTTISHSIELGGGAQDIAISALSGGFNINWVHFEPSDPVDPNPGSDEIAFVQAESYLAMSGVQLEGTSDANGGDNVGWIDAGDWMSFPSVSIPTRGEYLIEYRIASQSGSGRLQIEQAGGSQVFGALDIPSTGGWQTWVTVSHTVTLPAGALPLGIVALNGGWNLNWFRISRVQ